MGGTNATFAAYQPRADCCIFNPFFSFKWRLLPESQFRHLRAKESEVEMWEQLNITDGALVRNGKSGA